MGRICFTSDDVFQNMIVYQEKFILLRLKKKDTVFPLISAGPQISAAPLDIHIEISASL